MRRDELADLAAFAAVGEELSFTRAAKRLGISQSALSQIVKRLEQSLDTRLLTRTTRSMAPTKAGEELLARLTPMLEELDQLVASIGARPQVPSGTIRITSVEHAVNRFIVPALGRFLPEHPQIKVEIDIDYGLTDIVSSRFDAGVRLGEQVERDMIALPISPGIEMAVVASPSYLRGREKPALPRDLRTHQCLNLRMPTSGAFYGWQFAKGGKRVKVQLEGQLVFNALEPIRQAARAGLGIANLPLDEVSQELAAGSLVRILGDWSESLPPYHLYYPNRRHPASAFRLVAEALRWRGSA